MTYSCNHEVHPFYSYNSTNDNNKLLQYILQLTSDYNINDSSSSSEAFFTDSSFNSLSATPFSDSEENGKPLQMYVCM